MRAPGAVRQDFMIGSQGVLWANAGCGRRPFTGICILAYPSGTYIGWIEYYAGAAAYDMCSDSHGHVFVLEGGSGSSFLILKYGQDGSGPQVLDDVRGSWAGGCATDPTTGNLAVANTGLDKTPANLAVFVHARGSPKVYRASNLVSYAFCGYDDAGNLYVDGIGKDGEFRLDELAAGTSKFVSVTLNKKIVRAGPVEWDGKRLALGYGDSDGVVIYEVSLTGSDGKIVGSTHLFGPKHTRVTAGLFSLQGGVLVASYGTRRGIPVGLWKYPAGGEPIRTLRRGDKVFEKRTVTVSLAPH
jgi:hypothetical protein